MKPTQTELALVAVALSKSNGGTAKESLPDAYRLLSDAELFLEQEEANRKVRQRQKAEVPMELGDFLKAKLPTINTPSLRQRRFHQFLVECYLPKQTKGKPIEGSLDNLARLFFEEAKNSGVSIGAYPGFEQWYKARVSSGHAKGASATHAKRLAQKKEAEKIKAEKKAARHQKPHFTSLPDVGAVSDKRSFDEFLAQQNLQE